MNSLETKFAKLGIENAPGQEVTHKRDEGRVLFDGDQLHGDVVDFSHGDVDGHAFEPSPGALDAFVRGFHRGGAQAYTEYRGDAAVRAKVASALATFTGAPLRDDEVIITPGTQSALFLALACTVTAGDKVAIVQPDYFANRKIVEFLGAEIYPVQMDYMNSSAGAGIDLTHLESAFAAGVKLFLFSNPNNPTGVVYSEHEILQIAQLAAQYGATVIVDQLYSRLLYEGESFFHLRASVATAVNLITIMGPSKTESLSGFRLGLAFGDVNIVRRMEKLQAIVALRAPGYCQAVLETWFEEPAGWMADRITRHQRIRNELVAVLRGVDGVQVKMPQAGSYLFPQLPRMRVEMPFFIQALREGAGVTVTPGTEFGPHHGTSIRMNFSQNHHAAIEAAKRIAIFVERYRQI